MTALSPELSFIWRWDCLHDAESGKLFPPEGPAKTGVMAPMANPYLAWNQMGTIGLLRLIPTRSQQLSDHNQCETPKI